jgi:methionine-rich copper-binding protein CopC
MLCVRVRLLVAVLGVGALALLAGCAGEEEQGGLQAARPGPGATVGGEIDQIELLFDDIVAEAQGTVTGPDGADLDAEFVIDNQIRVLVELAEPLDVSGEYAVRSEVVSVVDDRVEESYVFTYDPAAEAPQLVFPPEEGSGSPWLLVTLIAVGVIVIVVLIARLVVSVRRLRSAPPPE